MKLSLTSSPWTLVWIPLGLMLLALFAGDPNLVQHLLALWSSPTQLTHDFIAIYGSGASLMNAGLLMLLNLFILSLAKVEMTGFVHATLFTVLGFSFIGITPINSLPLFIGAWIYDQFSELEFTNIIVVVMMGTSLAPVVNHLAGWIELGVWRYGLALVGGVLCGIYMVPMTKLVFPWHNGFNLYNVGFTTGLMAVVVQVLLISVGHGAQRVVILSTEFSWALAASVWGTVIGFGLIALSHGGFSRSNWIALCRHSGKSPSNFWDGHPQGLIVLNMALLGALSLVIVHALGVVVNGPILAALFSLIGFGAFGKHPANVWAPIIGSTLLALMLEKSIQNAGVLSIILFTSCLAPMTAHFGWGWAMMAGALHVLLAGALAELHGGLNLYNNGFTAGVVATLLLQTALILRKDLNPTKK